MPSLCVVLRPVSVCHHAGLLRFQLDHRQHQSLVEHDIRLCSHMFTTMTIQYGCRAYLPFNLAYRRYDPSQASISKYASIRSTRPGGVPAQRHSTVCRLVPASFHMLRRVHADNFVQLHSTCRQKPPVASRAVRALALSRTSKALELE